MDLVDELYEISERLLHEGKKLLEAGNFHDAQRKFERSLKVCDDISFIIGLPSETRDRIEIVN